MINGMHEHPRRGFTLVEIAIVLVIIGLISGGILVGRTLIHVAEIRSFVKQIEELHTAVNTFRGKYNCIPGDCPNALELGIVPVFIDPGTGQPAIDATTGQYIWNGNGDDKINMYNDFENYGFLYSLENAGLLPHVKHYAFLGPGYPYIDGPPFAKTIDGATPRLDIGYQAGDPSEKTSVVVSGNYYYLVGMSMFPYHMGALTPGDAFSIDNKLDDGLPRAGTVYAGSDLFGAWVSPNTNIPGGLCCQFDPAVDVGPPGENSNVCVTTDLSYNVANNSRALGALCSLQIKAQF